MSPLFILPGLLCNLSMFSATMEAFPGASGIDDFYGRETSLSAMAEYALARAPERFVLLGHSMGARIALEIMRRAPERVEALVLADTGIHPIQPKEREKRYALRDIGREQGFAALVDTWLPPMLTPAALADTALVADLRAMCISAGQTRFEEQIEALLARPEVEGLLPSIACPTLSIVGELDRWSPVAQHEQIAALIPGAALSVIAGAGHMLPAEDPAAFIGAIRNWLA
ncbi:alpha/beta fold hydrolase [Novosphingobium rosa]|uniref:alpha/beta fold hydrolase n=1 Tax=Novosphingobium rosa TaxID=76978 RepID=UPI00082E1274|nr:alpha/beta hydrolase [Novosphingobium rosa]